MPRTQFIVQVRVSLGTEWYNLAWAELDINADFINISDVLTMLGSEIQSEFENQLVKQP